MGVGADDRLTGPPVLLGQQTVFDAHLANFKVVGDLVLAGKLRTSLACSAP